MKEIFRRIDAWIPSGVSAFWVLGLGMLFTGAALRGLAGLFMLLEWHIAVLVTFWMIGLLVACFVGCVIWFVVDALASSPTPWRRADRERDAR